MSWKKGENEKFNIAICDDEHYFRENIKENVKNYMVKNGAPFHIDTFASGKEFIGLGIEIHQYKVVF